jgi:hypothetical protein
VQVVDAGSANPGLPGIWPIPVDADHIDICKPADRLAPVYGQVKRFIAEILGTVDHESASGSTARHPTVGRAGQRADRRREAGQQSETPAKAGEGRQLPPALIVMPTGWGVSRRTSSFRVPASG